MVFAFHTPVAYAQDNGASLANLEDDFEVEGDPRPLAQLAGRLAYNSSAGALAGVSFASDRLAPGLGLRLSAEAGENERRLQFDLRKTPEAGEDPVLGFRAFATMRQDGDPFEFDATSFGIEPQLTWRLDGGSITAFTTIARDRIENLAPGGSALISEYDRLRGAVGVRLERMIALNDATQLRMTFSPEVVTTDDSLSYLKAVGNVELRQSVAQGRAVLGARLSVGALSAMNGNTTVGDRFVLGGQTLRGFAHGGFGPRDLAAPGTPALGGENFAALRLDATFPGSITAAPRLTPGIFIDAGSLWGLGSVAGGPAGANPVDDAAHARGSIGISLGLQVGPGELGIVFAAPLREEDYDRTDVFQLQFRANF
jgi:outer membrane protein insertion porin family